MPTPASGYFDPPPGVWLPRDLADRGQPADFNGDGLSDLAFGTATEGWVALGPELELLPLPLGMPILAADLNGDGYDDLLVSDGVGQSVIEGTADGLTGDTTAVDAALWAAIPLGDVDRDGFDDLASGFAVWYGSSSGVEPGPTICPEPTVAFDGPFDAGDTDGDGHLDLLAVCGGNLVLLPGNGDRTFGDARPLDLSNGSMLLADADGDGVDELFYISRGNHEFFDTGEIMVVALTDPTAVTARIPIDGRRGAPGKIHDAVTGKDQLLFSVDGVLSRYELTDGDLVATTVTVVSDLRAELWWVSGADFDGDGVQEIVGSWFTTGYYDWGLLGIWGYDRGLEVPQDTSSPEATGDTAQPVEDSPPPEDPGSSGGCRCDESGGSALTAWLLAALVLRNPMGRKRRGRRET